MFRQRLIFCGFVFLPLFLCFLIPLVLLKWPAPLFYSVSPPFIASFSTAFHAFGLALLWFLLATVSLLLFKKRSPVIVYDWSPMVTMAVAIAFCFFGCVAISAYYFYSVPLQWLQLLHIFSLMPALSLALFIYLFRQFDSRFYKLICVFGFVVDSAFIFFVPILSGWSGQVVASFIGVLYVLVLVRSRLSTIVAAMLIFAVVIVSAMVLKDWVRYSFGKNSQPTATQSVGVVNIQSSDAGASAVKALDRLHDAMRDDTSSFVRLHQDWRYRYPSAALFKPFHYFYLKLMLRINRLTQFAYVLHQVPANMPFLYGETYKPILTIFMPRVFWPDKPHYHLGNDLGHRFHFYPSTNKVASVAMPYPLEAWLNFGWYGLLITPVLIGLMFGFLWN